LAEILIFTAVLAALLGLPRAVLNLAPDNPEVESSAAAGAAGAGLGLAMGVWMGCLRRPRLRSAILGGLFGPIVGGLIGSTTLSGWQWLCWPAIAAAIAGVALALRGASTRRATSASPEAAAAVGPARSDRL
jgi:MFS family permease